MFGWLFGNSKVKELGEKTERSFSMVKDDIESISKWVKHLDEKDKQLFDMFEVFKQELSSIKDEIGSLREGVGFAVEEGVYKQVSKKNAVLDKQGAVEGVQNAVQTAVQTGNFYEILQGLTSSERLVVMTLAGNSDGMKLSYEDLAMLLGKEKSTIRGQINSIRQKSKGLIMEIKEKNGKKRVFVPEKVREKLAKYAKVRVRKHVGDEE